MTTESNTPTEGNTMSTPARTPRTLPVNHWARDSYPAAIDSDDYVDTLVTQGHADYCAQYGHATVDALSGVNRCGRCGDVRTPAPLPTAFPPAVPVELAACGATRLIVDGECDVCGPTNRAVYEGTLSRGRGLWHLCAYHVVVG